MSNKGFDIELDIIDEINGKKYSELNDFMKECIKFMFPKVKNKDIITAYKYDVHAKTDIIISVNNQEKGVSIKSGNAKQVHEEGIKSFVFFLRSLNISQETQKTILYYHYGDLTMTGTGQRRFDYEQLQQMMAGPIKVANMELNNPEIIRKTVERFLFTGGYESTKAVDYIIFGNERYGSIASKEEIIKYALLKNTSYLNSLHIGPIIIRPKLRDIHFASMYQYKRDIVCGSWKELLGDVMKISNLRKHAKV